MSRSSLIVLLALGATFAGLRARHERAAAARRRSDVAPSVAAGPQTATSAGPSRTARREQVVFTVDRLEVTETGWKRARRRSTTDRRSAGSSHRVRRRKARSASSSSRPATPRSSTSATGAAPCRPSVPRRTTRRSSRGSSSPERRGKGRCPREGHSSPGAMRASCSARSSPSEILPRVSSEMVVWITDHAYQLRPDGPSRHDAREKRGCGSGSAPQLAGTVGPTHSSTTATCSRPSTSRKRTFAPSSSTSSGPPHARVRGTRAPPSRQPGHAPRTRRGRGSGRGRSGPTAHRATTSAASSGATRPSWMPPGSTSTFAAKRWPPWCDESQS